jgi:hypothetical protein
MAVEEITAKRWTCDGCGSSVKTEADEKPEGFHGKAEFATKKGETGGTFFACKRGCIQKAVRAVVGDGAQNGADEDDEVAPGFQRPNLPGNGPAV